MDSPRQVIGWWQSVWPFRRFGVIETFDIPDANYGQELMACVVFKPGANCTLDERNAFSPKERATYKTPKIIKFVSDLPKGHSIKVPRLKLL